MKETNLVSKIPQNISITDEDARSAFRTLLTWMGENPDREGLIETPTRVTKAWKEFFKGYGEDPKSHLQKSFEEIEGFNDVICLENIRLESYCEHHLVPITGSAYISYIPNDRVVGISKLARMMDGYAKRLQIQEKLTAQVAVAIEEVLKPRGVAVAIRSEHQCLSTRGVHKPGTEMLTVTTFGEFRNNEARRAEFMAMVNRNSR
jgi:GTP cyclohydrolase IA